MRKKILFLTLAVGAITGVAAAQDKTSDLAIIVAKGSTLDSVTSEELNKIFLEEKSNGPDGHKYIVTVHVSGSPECKAALGSIYKFDQGEYDTYFLRALFAGRIHEKPQPLNSGAAVRQYVAATAGAIGYVRASEVDDSIKIIKVDGKSPGDADYPLKIK